MAATLLYETPMNQHQSSALIKKQFWTIFGKYMSPVLSAEGEKINWINYKTGIRYIRFNIRSYPNYISISIELSHPDVIMQSHKFEELLQFKSQFETICGADFNWQKLQLDNDGINISLVSCSLNNVSIYNQANWPQIISFLKLHLISLDHFWCNYKYALE